MDLRHKRPHLLQIARLLAACLTPANAFTPNAVVFEPVALTMSAGITVSPALSPALDRPLLLRARELKRQLGDRLLWSQLNLELAAGDRLGLVAPSGAGKTLLLPPWPCSIPWSAAHSACWGGRRPPGVCPAGAQWCCTSPSGPSPIRERWRRTCVRPGSSGTPSARKVDASPSRPLFPPGGLMEQSNASLQRGRQG